MPTVDRVAFEIFGTPIYWYAIIIVIGMIIGVSIALFLAKRKGFVVDDILDIVLWVLPLAIIGARLYYVITDWDASWTFQRIFAIRGGTSGSPGRNRAYAGYRIWKKNPLCTKGRLLPGRLAVPP